VQLETSLYDGEYFFQDIEYKNLKAENPATAQSFGGIILLKLLKY
jgi:hypothetical protein